MKKLIFTAIALITVATACQKSRTRIQLHIDSDETYPEVALLAGDSLYRQTPDDSKTAVFDLPARFNPTFGAAFFGQKHVLLYMAPGESTDISVKTDNDKVVPSFSGEGAKKNRYLNETDFSFSPDYQLNETEFAASLDKHLQQLYQNLDAYGFDSTFDKLEKKRLKYTVYNALAEYRTEHLFAINYTQKEVNDEYFKILAEVFTEEEDMLNMAVYQNYIKKMVSYVTIHNMPEFEDFRYIQEELNYVTTHFKNPKVTEFMVDAIISEYIRRNGIARLAELAPIYQAKVTNARKKNEFEELCNKWRRIAPGQPSPEFAYEDVDGKIIRLSDFRGKYVYIDCWATWCGPCRREQPVLAELEKKYADRNIRFVSISCDQDKAAWEKVVRGEKLQGIHVIADEADGFMNAYMVNAIPHFILIDPEGKVVDAQMTRPSEPETEKLFSTLKGL